MALKLDYVTTYDVFDSSKWPPKYTGLYNAGYYLAQELQAQNFTLNYIGPLKPYKTPITRLKWLYYLKIQQKYYDRTAEPLILKDSAKQIEKKLSTSHSDLVFCPENATPLAELKCTKPLVLWTDAPIQSLINFYPYFNDLCQESIRNLYQLEKSAFEKCDRIFFSSDWAAEEAIKFFQLPAEKIRVIPWGANLESTRSQTDIEHYIKLRNFQHCQLLFIGVDWFRKGGDFALEVARHLNQAGLKTTLTIVGCNPPLKEPIPDFVKIIGFIDKSTESGKKQLDHLFSTSHFLLLPTQAETYGHVFIEANSYGVPSVATNVGGIPTIIQAGKNGKTFPLETESSAYAQYILETLQNSDLYESLALSSFHEYQSRLNWKVSVQAFKQSIEELIG